MPIFFKPLKSFKSQAQPGADLGFGSEGTSLTYVLLAHGSRDTAWQAPMERIAQTMRGAGLAAVCAYLEYSSPDLSTALADLQARGACTVCLVPLFLGAGKHVRSDLPRMLAQARANYPLLRLRMAPVLGDTPAFIQQVAQIIGNL